MERKTKFLTISCILLVGVVHGLPPKARILVQYPLSDSDNSSAIEVLNDIQNTETVLTEAMVSGNIYLECVASYPIEWIYEGDGYPDGLTFFESKRAWTDFSDPTTFTFSVRVDLLAVKEKNTGLYSCRKLGTPQVKTYFYIYVPGRNIFLSDTSKKSTVKSDDEIATLPCTVTNPTTKVLLFKVNKEGSLDPISDASFEPSVGFKINVKDSLTHPLGHYICMAVKEKKVLKISLEAPKSEIVQVFPNTKYVRRKEGLGQNFSCEGVENVTISINNVDILINVTHEEIQDSDSRYKYRVILETIPSDELNQENFTEINCVGVESRKVLHTWEYTTFGEEDVVFSYNSDLNAFMCCTPSYHRPEISRISCASPMECHMKKYSCLRNPGKCCENQRYNQDGIPDSCVMFPESESHSEDGMFLCSVGDVTKEFYFAWGIGRIGHPIIRFDQITSSDDIIQIQTNHSGMIFVNEEVEISCHPSRFFFSNDPVWGFERMDGSMEIVDKSLIRDDLYFEKRVTIPKRRRTVKFPDVDIKSLVCFAPSWFSATEWKNVSFPVTVISKDEEDGIIKATTSPILVSESNEFKTN